jgi:phosphopantetheine adenylyltransferase
MKGEFHAIRGGMSANAFGSIWGLVDFGMPLELFCTRLKAERRKIIKANKRQIWRYLKLPINRPTAATFATGIGAFPVDYESLVVSPATPEEIMELVRYREMQGADALEVAA